MKKSKLDRMIGMMKEFETVFSSLTNENLRRHALICSGSAKHLEEEFNKPECKVPRAAATSGFEQGLIEFYYELCQSSDESRGSVLLAFRNLCADYDLNFLNKIESKIANILNRDRIKTDNEFYLMRSHLDYCLILGKDDEAGRIDDLLAGYELK
jgi:hypothetical protein